MILLLVIATAWIVLHGRITTSEADHTESKCGGCRYATECPGKVHSHHAECTASCGAMEKEGGCDGD